MFRKLLFATVLVSLCSFGKANAKGFFSTEARFVAVVAPGCYEVLVIVNYTDDGGQTSVVAWGSVLVGQCPPKTHKPRPGAHPGCPPELYAGDYFVTMEGSRQCLTEVIKNQEVYTSYQAQRNKIIEEHSK